jgi:hypothetical protein
VWGVDEMAASAHTGRIVLPSGSARDRLNFDELVFALSGIGCAAGGGRSWLGLSAFGKSLENPVAEVSQDMRQPGNAFASKHWARAAESVIVLS